MPGDDDETARCLRRGGGTTKMEHERWPSTSNGKPILAAAAIGHIFNATNF